MGRHVVANRPVLEALSTGAKRWKDLQLQTCLPKATLTNCLKRMLREGLVQPVLINNEIHWDITARGQDTARAEATKHEIPLAYVAVVEKLAFKAPLTINELAKEMGCSISTLPASLKRLRALKLVKSIEEKYQLSFIGLMKYFMRRFRDQTFGKNEVKQIIQTYATLDDHPLLKEYAAFEEWLGDRFYNEFLSSASSTDRQIESSFTVIWARANGPIKRGELVKISGLKLPTLEEEEAEWKNTFALWFFTFLPKEKVKLPSNPKIQTFIQETFSREISAKKNELAELERSLASLTNHD